MSKRVEDTIAWYVQRTTAEVLPISRIVDALIAKHGMTQLEAEEVIHIYAERHFGTVPK